MKLVRDKIPEIILSSGRECSTRKVYGNDEHLVWLKKKMEEETKEFLKDPCVEEAADIYEVFLAMVNLAGLSLDEVTTKAYYKREERGGFTGGIILERADVSR